MLPDIRTACQLHFAYLTAYADSGRKHIMEFAEYLHTETDTLPDELRPLGQALTAIAMRMLTESYGACLVLLSELGLQEITKAAQGSQGSTPADDCPSQQEAAENKWRE